VATFDEKRRLPAKSSDFRRKTATSGKKERETVKNSKKRPKMARKGKKDREAAKKEQQTAKTRERTDTIQYEYSSIRNGRYRYRYEYSLHCGVPATTTQVA